MNRFSFYFAKHKGLLAKHLRSEGKKAIGINDADVAELVDARDLKSLDGNVVWVRVPPPAPPPAPGHAIEIICRNQRATEPANDPRSCQILAKSHFALVAAT
jgi:hypothetical protein